MSPKFLLWRTDAVKLEDKLGCVGLLVAQGLTESLERYLQQPHGVGHTLAILVVVLLWARFRFSGNA